VRRLLLRAEVRLLRWLEARDRTRRGPSTGWVQIGSVSYPTTFTPSGPAGGGVWFMKINDKESA
jgi:hypothetical protein